MRYFSIFLVFACIYLLSTSVLAQTCSPGYFYEKCEDDCVECPPGYYCEGSDIPKKPCPAGTYRNQAGATAENECPSCSARYYSREGSESCSICPLGYTCADPAQSPQQCSTGTYSASYGSTSCTTCPAGHYCPRPNVDAIPCPKGTYSSSGQSQCTKCSPGTYASMEGSTSCASCPAGSKCPTPGLDPIPCPFGMYSSSNSHTCLLCPLGRECLDPSQTPQTCPEGTFSPGGLVTECIECPSGTYSASGASACTVCEAGYECEDKKSSTRQLCPAGFFSPSNFGGCQECPPGTSVNTNGDGCDVCPTGSKCAGADATATTCPAGHIAPFARMDECLRCLPGMYADSDNAACLSCPAGSQCPNSQVETCPDGYYSLGGAASCIPAPAGTHVVSKAQFPQRCPVGEWSDMGSTTCQTCPAGSQCTLPYHPTRCPDGTYSTDGDVVCLPCPNGYSCSDPAAPQICAAGTYSTTGDPECHSCPPGFFCVEGESRPTPCADGFYSTADSSACTECEAGNFCPDPSSAPITCPDGTYSSPGQMACSKCREGSSCSSKVSSPSSSLETVCPAGQIAAAGATSCKPCPAGMACPDPKGFRPVVCSPGHYSDSSSQRCERCPEGYSCANPAEAPQECPPGTFSYSGAAECSICPAGHYCEGGASSPVLCPVNSYSVAGESDPNCQTCEAGYTCVGGSTSGTPDDGLCPAGSYCEAGETKELCPPGTYGVGQGLTTEDSACSICPAGYYCPVGTDDVNEASKCPRGFYCPAGTTFATEFPCPEGTYNPTIGAKSEGDCQVCPAGYYCDQGTDHYGEYPCSRGFFCPEGTKSIGDDQGPQRCPDGTYYPSLGAKNVSDCQACPPGYYCGPGSGCDESFTQMLTVYNCPSACPRGTYNPSSYAAHRDSCQACPEGYTCPEGESLPNRFKCYPGYFCEQRTQCFTSGTMCIPRRNNPDYRCPAGTYTTSYHLKKREDCSICWAGYACPSYDGSLGCPSNPGLTGNGCPIGCEPGSDCPTYTRTMIICSPGHYCPGAMVTGNGSNPYTLANFDGEYAEYPDQFDCPPGTYSDASGLKSADECTMCERGNYCNGGGTAPDGVCPEGHYCPDATTYDTEFPCPAGTYNNKTGLINADQCTECPTGAFCPTGSETFYSCPAGTYNPSEGASSLGPITVEEALAAIQSEAEPDFEDNLDVDVALTRQLENSQCVVCPAGYFCGSNSTVTPTICLPGTYSDSRETNCTICPAGHYCHRNGTRGDFMREEFICPAGMYCPEGTDSLPDKVEMACPSGKYCPRGTEYPINCPAGTYNPYTGAGRPEDCLSCPRGQYCEEGASEITGNCSLGHYCPFNSTKATQYPCPANTYRDRESAYDQNHCSVCPNGHYCPEGTGEPLGCPQGYYCIIGISIPLPCPKGTYGNSTGLIAITECTDCDPGYYCDTLGRTEPTGKCDAGYYCLLGANTAAPVNGVTGDLCPRGGYCPAGSSGPTDCAPGTFNNYSGGKTQADCAPCTPGYYCAGSSNPYPSGPCTAGYYCISDEVEQASTPRQYETTPGHYSVEGSKTEIPCPAGTYTLDYVTANECDPCDPGFYCPNVGTSDRDENPCPAGSYCPSGSVLPTGCPKGTFGSDTRFQNASQCETCPVGQYCDGDRLTAPSGDCLAGYICYGSSQERNPIGETYGDQCPKGHWCGVGTDEPTACSQGTYNPLLGARDSDFCLSCPAGSYCQGTGKDSASGKCSAGYYCPSGFSASTSTPSSQLCSIGKYCPEGTASELMCADGEETLSTGRTTCQPCAATKYCSKGSQRNNCPQGRYCPEGTGLDQEKCPPGSFSADTSLQYRNECTLCTSGKFCSGWGLAAPDGDCLPGTYCDFGASDTQGAPGELGGSSTTCPLGHYCPAGTQTPQTCPPGTFASTTGLQAENNCQPCSAGYYCPSAGQDEATALCGEGFYCSIGATVAEPGNPEGNSCPQGHYCPEGSPAPIPCDDGFFQDQTQQASCKQCPAGSYCVAGSTSPEACPEGLYCPNATGIVIPKCPSGSYSNQLGLEAMNECTLCDGGRFCSVDGLSGPDGDCAAGVLCTNGASDERGTSGILGGSSETCPKGHYCEVQTVSPTPCPVGFFANWTGNTDIDGCSPCRPGFYCDEEGTIEPSENLCAAGYYCISKSSSATPTDGVTGDICPAGSYCEEGSVFPTPCEPGTFANGTGHNSCNSCPAGYFCEGGTVTPELCPQGRYCPPSTTYEIPECPTGTFSNRFGLKNESDCTICSPGRVCSVPGLVQPDGLCGEGYFCVNGSINSFGAPGTLGGEGGPCPSGHYCPLGSSTPTACEAGTFNPKTKKSRPGDCVPCRAGEYCPFEGASQTEGGCEEGYFCTNSSTTPTPASNVCPPGSRCPEGTKYPHICVDGTYQEQEGKGSCITCPAGNVCNSNSTSPNSCPVGNYCPQGRGYPLFCAAGTYGSEPGLSSQDDCSSCPAGKFCTNGRIRGPCHAGYVCYGGSWTASPKTIPVSIGELCPIGYYCPEGTEEPVPCPEGTVGTSSGGRNSTICGPCPKGFYCLGQTNVGQPCPPGSYCPAVIGVASKCPQGTYNPISRATNESACLPCKAGYTCPEEGQSDFTDICPVGNYCPENSIEPVECPRGTFRNSTGGQQTDDCATCPEGHYCPLGTSDPVLCGPATYCIAGSREEVTCPSGHYCKIGDSSPRVCPAANYCPEGSSSPILCPRDSYCPTGTDEPIPCPYGYRTLLTNTLSRTSLSDSCEICPPGQYGNTTDQLECFDCDAGYVCLEGATSPNPVNRTYQKGYICPAGHYCPEGTSEPVACPVGTYRAETGAKNETYCLNCEANTYSTETGATECQACGSSSTSKAGSTTCNCVGDNRVYQRSDGTCLCRSGYTFFDANNQEVFGDSTESCIEIVYSRCGAGETHDANGNCVSSSSSSCNTNCAAGGTFMPIYGLCECNELQDVTEVCNADCRANRRQVGYDSSSQQLSVSSTNASAITFPSDVIDSGDLSRCEAGVSSTCKLHIVRSSSTGFIGVYNPSASYLSELFSEDSSQKKRNAGAEDDATTLQSPIVCLEQGSGILFDVSESKSNFPSYAVNSLLNTVTNFDYGPFRTLSTLMPSSVPVKTFAHFFNTPGTYVFSDAGNSEKLLIVKVQEEGSQCPSNQTFSPLSEENLNSLNIEPLSTIPLTPDWMLVGMLLLGFFSLSTSAVGCLTYFKSKGWVDLNAHKKKKISEMTSLEEKMKMLKEDDSNFDITLFYEEMDSHAKNVSNDISSYRNKFSGKYDNLLKETKLIKALLDKSKGNRKGVFDTQLMMEDIAKPQDISEIPIVLNKLKLQVKDFESELDSSADYSKLDTSDMTTQQTNIVKKLVDVSEKEKQSLSKTINMYKNALKKLEQAQQNLSDEDLSEDEAENILSQFNNKLNDFKDNIATQLEHLNSNITDRNSIEDEFSQKSHVFNLDTGTANQLKGFLTKKVKEMFDKFDLVEDSDDESDESDEEEEEEDESVEPEESKATTEEEKQKEEESIVELSTDDRAKTFKKRRKRHMARLQKEEIQALEEDFEEEQLAKEERINQVFGEMEGDYLNQMRKTTNERVRNGKLEPRARQNLLETLNKKTSDFKKSVTDKKKGQMEVLQKALEKKRDAKADLVQQKQQREKEMLEKTEKEDKKALKKIMKNLYESDAVLNESVSLELLKQKETLKHKLATGKQKMMKKHAVETKELEKLLNAEDKLDRKALKDEIKQEHSILVEQRRMMYDDLAEQEATNKEHKDELMKGYNSKLVSYRKHLAKEREKATEQLEEEIAQRRQLRKRQLEKKHAEEEAEQIKEQENDLKALRKLMENAAVSSEDLEGARSREKIKQAKAIEEKLAEMKRKQKEKKQLYKDDEKEIDAQIEQELEEEMKNIEQKFAADRKMKMRNREEELAQKLQEPDVTEQKKEQLLATHRMHLQDYDEKMSGSKKEQIENLKKRLEEKRKSLKRKKKMEQHQDMTKDLLDQEKQLDRHFETTTANLDRIDVSVEETSDSEEEFSDMEKKRMKEDEHAFEEHKKKLEEEYEAKGQELKQSQQKKVFALKSKMQADLASSSEKEKDRIMDDFNDQLDTLERKNQHEADKQRAELTAKLEAHRQKLKKKRKKDLKKERKEHKKSQGTKKDDKLREAEHRKILDLLMNDKEPVHSIEDAINKVLAGRHERETQQLSAKLEEELKNADSDEKKATVNLKNTKKRVKLKEKQIQEKNDLAKDFEKYQHLLAKGNEDTQQLEQEYKRFSDQINKQKEDNKKRIEAEKEKLRHQMEKEIEEANRKAEEEKKALEARMKEEKNKIQVQETIKQREEEVQKMLEKQKNLEKGERERLLEQHKLNIDNFEDALEMERRRQEKILAKRIKQYEKQRQEEEKEKLRRRLEEAETGVKSRKKLESPKDSQSGKQEGSSVLRKQSTMSLIHHLDSRKPKALPGSRLYKYDSSIIDEMKWMEPILQKIRNIEKLLVLQYPPYCDQRDLSMNDNEGELKVVPVGELSPKQLIVFKFGEFVIHLLRSRLNIRLPVNLAVASSLPHTDYAHNAFKHSFFYQTDTSTLFIRNTRLSYIGKFVVLIAHCMAHITFGNLESDLHPDFVKNYYSMMEVIFEDIFNVRNQNSSPEGGDPQDRDGLVQKLIDLSQRPLQSGDMLNQVRLQPGKTEVDVMMRYNKRQTDDSSSIKTQEKKSPDDAKLKQELMEAETSLRKNQQYIQSFTTNLKKIDDRVKAQEEAAAKADDATVKKEQAKLKAYKKQREELARKLKSSNAVHDDLQKKIASIKSKLSK